MSMNHVLPKKIDLKPKKYHGFYVVLVLLGWLLPPLAIAARFGIGIDFFINVILTCCGYFPGHFHNFYCQNIRNNTNRGRTPKWALKAGLVNSDDRDRRARKNQWAKRFDERNAYSAHVGQSLEEGEEGENYVPVSEAEREREMRREREGLWRENEDTEYYNEDQAPNQRNWHYPANFEGAASGTGTRKFGKKNKGDRWERSRASRSDSTSSGSTYPPAASADDDVPEWGRDYGAKRRSSKSKRKTSNSNLRANDNGYGNGYGNGGAYADDVEREDGWGSGQAQGQQQPNKRGDDVFNHQF
ncbi:hypothetical protein DB88DRAFT_496814 [Papiliotrema laurentii]|uniref:Uncharacterized protein n=1 Tax=Papiliotrema laurentii TaxID=5418 RepID=A0AAD9CUZ0_PAPLA|nr:hypothetical protein DB88DRAFT_496814 [Papiliotrema laurentii]